MSYKHIKIADLEDQAPGYGVDTLEARGARSEMGAERIGLTSYKVKPGRRVGFGHNHEDVEEVYFVVAGAGRFRVDDEILDIAQGEIVYCSPEVMREWEAGDDGLELIAFGAHAEGDGNMEPGWWTD